jgi:hypothetical protein
MYKDSRRGFLKASLAMGVGAAAGVSHAQTIQRDPSFKGVTDKSKLPKGRLMVLAYMHARHWREYTGSTVASSLLSVAYPGRALAVTASSSTNLHDIAAPLNNPDGVLFGVGHDVREVLEIFNPDLSLRTTLRFDGIRFKGHAFPYGKGILIAAESSAAPDKNGFLLYLDSKGTVLSKHTTGGLGPHEIVECGEYLAVAHYGSAPRKGSYTVGHMYDLVSPGVSFLKKDNLQFVAFHELPDEGGAITHLAHQGNGQVVAMGMNALKPVVDGPISIAVMREAIKYQVDLLAEETGPNAFFHQPIPLHYVDVEKGITGKTDAIPRLMRRGQSFAQDWSLGLTVATFAASQTLLVQDARTKKIRFLNTLDYGVADPRGCAMIPGTACVAVSGNANNIAIINLINDSLVDLIGVPLEQHSHMRWLSA